MSKQTWSCHVCTYNNALSSTQCAMCETAMPDTVVKVDSELQSQPMWSCPKCTFDNEPSALQCKMCGSEQESQSNIIEQVNLSVSCKQSHNMQYTQIDQIYRKTTISIWAMSKMKKMKRNKIPMTNQYIKK